MKEIRWRQRFENFSKAFHNLREAVTAFDKLDKLSKEGLIQRYEYTFELAWKTLKDYLESKDVKASFPRDVIKEAFQYELIRDGDIWMEMLEKRNLLSHTYNEELFIESLESIKNRYFPAVGQVYDFLKKEI